MADAESDATSTLLAGDEDDIPHHNDHVNGDDGDEEDDGEGVDFRFLSSSVPPTTPSSRGSAAATAPAAPAAQGLPKRGTKDFEPNATQSQRHTLSASRQAMYDALSAVRVHASGRTHNVGLYVNWDRPEELEQWRRRLGGGDDDDKNNSNNNNLNLDEWRKRWCVVFHFKGVHGKTLGKSDRRGWTWLLPEEALFLLERGSLDIRWPVADEGEGEGNDKGDDKGNDDDEVDKDIAATGAKAARQPPIGTLPMSLQGAYASFIGKSGLTLERYLVYAGLKRSGYVVQRAPTWGDESESDNSHANSNGNASNQPLTPAPPPPPPTSVTVASRRIPSSPALSPPPVSLIHRLLSWLINPRIGTPNPCVGPLVAPGLYRNYNDVFRSLALIPYHHSADPGAAPAPAPATVLTSQPPKSPFTLSWLVYKPSTPYRKSAPPSPDYRVCVVDARATTVPSLTQIGDLLDTMPDEQQQQQQQQQQAERPKRIEVRIKQGRRSVLVAVVDLGVVSYLRFAECETGRYKLYEEKGQRRTGSKGKGKGGGGSGKARSKAKGGGKKESTSSSTQGGKD